jgi:polyphosphate kinase 2 (PPK2 family)
MTLALRRRDQPLFRDRSAERCARPSRRQRRTHSGPDSYPYDKRMDKDDYEDAAGGAADRAGEMQADVKATGKRVVVVFEGRDAAGKGGTIKRVRENLNPRVARVVALSEALGRRSGAMVFPALYRAPARRGRDRALRPQLVQSRRRGTCLRLLHPEERAAEFFRQLPEFEDMLVDEGSIFVKIWLNVGRAEQLRRFLERESDPLKQWKLSWIDVEGLKRWDAYSDRHRRDLRSGRPPRHRPLDRRAVRRQAPRAAGGDPGDAVGRSTMTARPRGRLPARSRRSAAVPRSGDGPRRKTRLSSRQPAQALVDAALC